jgi:hypothetical protein
MASRKAPKKFNEKVDKKTQEEQVIQSELNSPYNLLIPGIDCKFAYLRDPLSLKIQHFEIKKEEFYSKVEYLVGIGLGPKLRKDFAHFAETIDPNWGKVANDLVSKGIEF